MRTAAFPSFRKLYGRILLEENLKLAHDLDKNNRYFNKILKVYEKFQSNKTNFEIKLNLDSNKLDYKTIRLPKGQYYVDINYSNFKNKIFILNYF